MRGQDLNLRPSGYETHILCFSGLPRTPHFFAFLRLIKAISHIEPTLPFAPSRYILCLIESMRSPWIDGNERRNIGPQGAFHTSSCLRHDCVLHM
ncbi:hypothetical protein MCP1_650010 [Candidatus Terasakiella magnetica]|nr:hypothetical protein MCP1_650010 [Candidatus Terasakiella magnetica]